MPSLELELNKHFGKWERADKGGREREANTVWKLKRNMTETGQLAQQNSGKGKLQQSRVCLQVQLWHSWLRICDAIKAPPGQATPTSPPPPT